MTSRRIGELDGLRVTAAFGVVWIHTWTLFGNPSLKIGPIDFYRVTAIFGNGAHFSFVLSGFLMYMILSKQQFSWLNYKNFLFKRWKRLAPAFYVSAIVYAGVFYLRDSSYNFFPNLFINFLFLQNFLLKAQIIGPFWSLGTEWHFYMILPVLFVANGHKFFLKRLCIASAISIVFLILMAKNVLSDAFWQKEIFSRFIEFSWGLLAAYCYTAKITLPKFFSGWKGIFFGMAITYFGRLLMVTEVVHSAGSFGWTLKALSSPIMTFGYAFLCYRLITEKSALSRMLSSSIMRFLSKISYSVYLWHSLVLFILFRPLKLLNGHIWSAPVGFIAVTFFTVAVSLVSYKFLEEPYFKKTSVASKNLSLKQALVK